MDAGADRALQSRLVDGQLSMAPAETVRDASEQLLSRVRRLNRIAKLALVTVAIIVTGGTIALEGTTRWIVHTRDVLRVIRTTQTRLVDREVHVLNARMSGRDASADAAGRDVMRQVDIAFDSLLGLTEDNPTQLANVRTARALAAAWDQALVAGDSASGASLQAQRDAMRVLFATMLDDEQRLYDARVRTLRVTRGLMLVAVLVALALVWFALSRFVTSTARQIARTAAAQRERDITRQRLSFVLENAPLAVAIVAPDDRLELENPAWRALGLEVGSETPSSLRHLVAAARVSGRMEFAEIATAPVASLAGAAPAAAPSVWMANAYPIDGTSPEYTGRVGLVLLDVTEQRAMEARMRQGQRLEALGQLAGGVAHDFNNILTAVIGFTDLVYESMPDDGRFRADLLQVRRAADRAAMLTRQLLTFSRQQVLQPRTLSVEEVVKDLEPMLRRIIGSHVTLRVECAPDLWPVFIDVGQLEQVIVNLVINARDALPDGGDISIVVKNVTRDPDDQDAAQRARAGEYVSLGIHDTGVGIPEDVRQHIFEPFFSTKEAGKGTGLGLATVLGIVQRADGWVEVDSGVALGTTFDVLLPHRPGTISHVSNTALAGVRRQARASGSVLVVDDDRDVRQLMEYVLSEAGYTVVTTTNGVDALAHLRRPAVACDLVITDLVMPGLGGLALARRLRDEARPVSMLFVSGYASDSYEHQTVLPPDAHFLAKPFTPAQLLDAAARALGRAGH